MMTTTSSSFQTPNTKLSSRAFARLTFFSASEGQQAPCLNWSRRCEGERQAQGLFSNFCISENHSASMASHWLERIQVLKLDH